MKLIIDTSPIKDGLVPFVYKGCCDYLRGVDNINTRFWLNCLTIYRR